MISPDNLEPACNFLVVEKTFEVQKIQEEYINYKYTMQIITTFVILGLIGGAVYFFHIKMHKEDS